MITAKEARDLVAAKDNIAAALADLETAITASASAGLLFLEQSMENEILAVQLTFLLNNLGYMASYQAERQILKIKWA